MSRIEYWRRVAQEAEEGTELRKAAMVMVRAYKKWGKEND